MCFFEAEQEGWLAVQAVFLLDVCMSFSRTGLCWPIKMKSAKDKFVQCLGSTMVNLNTAIIEIAPRAMSSVVRSAETRKS